MFICFGLNLRGCLTYIKQYANLVIQLDYKTEFFKDLSLITAIFIINPMAHIKLSHVIRLHD